MRSPPSLLSPSCQCYYCIFHDDAGAGSLKNDTNHVNVVEMFSWERYRRRVLARRRDLEIVDGIYTLKGSSTDTHSGNVTPAEALVHVTASTNLGFQGNVSIGRGTIHNNPAEGTWQGHFGADSGGEPRALFCRSMQKQRSSGSTSRWRVFFEERLPTNRGCFDYAGIVDMQTGMEISGTFKWSMLAGQNRGSFFLSVMGRQELHS